MRLHILAGCRDLLRPCLLPGEQVAGLIGPAIRPATAFWLSSRCGRFYHDFLLDEAGDRRIEIFAASLRDSFGTRFEPLLVLPELFAAATGATSRENGTETGTRRRALDMLLELWSHHPAEEIRLHALVLPEGIDADGSWAAAGELLAPRALSRLDGLRISLAASGLDPDRMKTRAIEVRRDQPEFEILLRNAIACQLTPRVQARLAEEGLAAADLADLQLAVLRVLEGWRRSGIAFAPALGTGDLDRLAGHVMKRLIEDVPANA